MKYKLLLSTAMLALFMTACIQRAPLQISKWEKLTLSFTGPPTSESDADNPFLNYRLLATFTHADKSIEVPGFFAADGNAAESGSDAGNVWQVRFRPDKVGEWRYKISFRKGKDLAISDDPDAGEAVALEGEARTLFDGEKGRFVVNAAEEGIKGRINYTGGRYLQYAETGAYFLKGGADSPENFLAFADFDGTMKGEQPQEREGEASGKEGLHRYEPHLQDWKQGDPLWQGDKGKGIIGALNYLAGKGMNSVYFLTMNIGGDGKDVWPYTSYEERLRFDCSKLDQWEMVFDHMDQLGLMLHIVLQETENETLLDGGDTRYERKLYYRELIARFAHHLGITWNMGEENGPANFSPNGQTTAQQKAMVAYIQETDPYENMVVIHTHSANQNRREMYTQMLGDSNMDGMSIQVGNRRDSHSETIYWLNESGKSGKQWVVCIDEIGKHYRGVDPDEREQNNQDSVRAEVLWGNLMAGGGGVEWYFGYRNPHNDLGCEDWRSRDRMWDYTRVGLEFFRKYLPFHEMESRDDLITASGEAYCFAKPGEVYAVYLAFGGSAEINLEDESGEFDISWYDPQQGGELQKGSVASISGGETSALGTPPSAQDQDWAILIRKK